MRSARSSNSPVSLEATAPGGLRSARPKRGMLRDALVDPGISDKVIRRPGNVEWRHRKMERRQLDASGPRSSRRCDAKR
jgi:hypothetical protein